MKNFIFFLGEESKSPIHASKSWVDIAGNFSPVRHAGDPLDIHHLHMVVDNPEKFGTTHQELEKIDPEEYKRLKNRTLTWSEGILKHVGNRGHMRVVRRGNAVAIEHHGADNFDPSHFVNAVKKIKKTIGRRGSVDISLVGPIPNNPREQPFSKWITSMSELNDFIGEKGGSTLKSVTSAPEVSSTELRAMQPKKPPSDMPRFLFKNMFTIGDSYIKSFKDYISEDILGGYDPLNIQRRSRSEKGTLIPDIDTLVSKVRKQPFIGTYVPNQETKIVKLDDKFHMSIDPDPPSEDPKSTHGINVRIFSSKPGHENVPLMKYSLLSKHDDYVNDASGKSVRLYSGTPLKSRMDVRRGVFRVPKNFLHEISKAMDIGISSGVSQSSGAIKMWRKAVRHGHEIGHHVERFHEVVDPSWESSAAKSLGFKPPPGSFKLKSFGKITPRNFSDAYSLDVSTRRTGNKSKVPSGMVRDIPAERDLPPERKALGTRSLSKLIILPK